MPERQCHKFEQKNEMQWVFNFYVSTIAMKVLELSLYVIKCHGF